MNRFRLTLALLLASGSVALLVWLGRGAPAPRQQRTAWWVESDLAVVRPTDGPAATTSLWDGQAIHLTAARNEVVAWQVALRPASAVVGGRIQLDALRGEPGTLASDAFTAFREHLLTVKVPSQVEQGQPALGAMGPGDYPNQLLPLLAGDAKLGTFDAPAGRTTALWCDLVVPAEAVPGRYRATLTVEAPPALRVALPVELTVLPFALPTEQHFKTWFYYGPEQVRGFYAGGAREAEDRLRRLAHDHRMNLIPEHYVPGKPAEQAEWWDDVRPWLDGTAYTSGPCRGAAAPLIPIAMPDEVTESTVKAMARATVGCFEAKGLLDRAFLYACDEPNDAAAYATARRIGGWVKEAVGRKLAVMVTEQVEPTKPEWGSLESAVDIFCSEKTSSAEMRRWKDRGGRIWVYNGGLAGPGELDCPLAGVAAWGPAAWRFDLDAWFQWETCYWRQKHVGAERLTDLYVEPLTFDEMLKPGYDARYAIRMNGDGVWFCPGEPERLTGPVATLRVKAFRRGAQDFEYLWLLSQSGHKPLADSLARRLSTGRMSYESNADVWAAVRREAATALSGER